MAAVIILYSSNISMQVTTNIFNKIKLIIEVISVTSENP